MSQRAVQETVTILDKEYHIACQPHERDALHESARLLDQKMREIRASGKVIGTERVAVMAALNLAHDLLQKRRSDDDLEISVQTRLRLMQEKIDAILSSQDSQLAL